jgi:hypothetical protein
MTANMTNIMKTSSMKPMMMRRINQEGYDDSGICNRDGGFRE